MDARSTCGKIGAGCVRCVSAAALIKIGCGKFEYMQGLVEAT